MRSKIRVAVVLGLMVAGSFVAPQIVSADAENPDPVSRSIGSARGYSHCVTDSNGAVQCWGGEGNYEALPNSVASLKFREVMSGVWGACGILLDSTLRCWGSGAFDSMAGYAALENVEKVAVGDIHACALMQDGEVTCWGSNRYGQARVPNGLTGVLDITAGGWFTCALLQSRTVQCWGLDGNALLNPPADLPPVSRLASSYWNPCAIGSDQLLRCWGIAPYGLLNIPSNLGPVRDFDGGEGHSCAVKVDFAVVCWGPGGNNLLPDGLRARQMTAGFWDVCVLGMRYEVRCFAGDNRYGRLSVPQALAAKLPLPRVQAPTATAVGSDSVEVRWAGLDNFDAATMRYVARIAPGSASCTTTGTACTFNGLNARTRYKVSVSVQDNQDEGEPSLASNAVTPLTAEFQTWPVQNIMAVGSSTDLCVGRAPAFAEVTITGATTALATTDAVGLGCVSFSAIKTGTRRFAANYSVKVGKKTTKYTATTQLYVPSFSGPMLKIKQGKTGKFSLQFMPPGAAVSIALSDGRTLTGTADSSGKASFTPTFNTLGAVTYTASVAGVQIGTGGLTVTK